MRLAAAVLLVAVLVIAGAEARIGKFQSSRQLV